MRSRSTAWSDRFPARRHRSARDDLRPGPGKLERLSGIREGGHAALLAWIHDWLACSSPGAGAKRAPRRSPPRRRRDPAMTDWQAESRPEPTSSAGRSARGHAAAGWRPDLLRGLRRGRGDDDVRAAVGDIHSRMWKAQVPRFARDTGWSRAMSGATAIGAARPRGLRRSRERGRLVAVSTRPGPSRPPGHVLGQRAGGGCCSRGRNPKRVAGLVFIGPGAGDRAQAARAAQTFHHRPGRRRGLGEVQPALLAAGTTAGSSILLRRDVLRAALDQADRGRRRLGHGDEPETLALTLSLVARPGERARRCARGSRCPVLVIHGDRRPHPAARGGEPLAEATGGAGHARRRRPRPDVRDPVRVNRLLREFVASRAAAPPAGPAGAAGAEARAVHLLADRPRPRAARRRDRPRAARAAARPGDRLARPAPGDRGAGGGRRAHPPGQRAAGQRVAPHRDRVGRARPALLPGLPPDGRDPGRELHGLPRRRARRATTTCGSATRPGTSTTTCTRTRSSSAPPTCG